MDGGVAGILSEMEQTRRTNYATLHRMAHAAVCNVYRPSSRANIGFLRALGLFARDLWSHRQPIAVQIKSDWTGIYKGSYLGTFWAVVMAVTPMSVYMLLGWLKILPTDGAMPLSVYIAAGVTVWMLIAETITTSINGLRGAAASLSGSQMPLCVGLVAHYGVLISDTVIRLAALILFVLFSGAEHLSWTLLLFPVLIVPVLLFGIGLGFVLASFNVVFPDIDPLTGMILRYLVFFSCAFFPLPEGNAFLQQTLNWNVPAQLVMGVRELMILGHVDHPQGFAIACIASLAVFLFGIRTFYRLEPHIEERL